MSQQHHRRFRPMLVSLEDRVVPAWWAVTAPSPAGGTLGDTAATHSGQLTFNPDYAPDAAGRVTVFADTALGAAAKAVRGTVGVTLTGQTTTYAFGPDTLGATPADRKPFLATVSGNAVNLAFEDMAGQVGCDYDYNDRSWGGVTASSAPDPVVNIGSPSAWPWDSSRNPAPGGESRVSLVVTRPDEATLRWTYTVANYTFSRLFASPGLYRFELGVSDTSIVYNVSSSLGWGWSASGTTVRWEAPSKSSGPFIAKGSSATFRFDTPPAPPVASGGRVVTAPLLASPGIPGEPDTQTWESVAPDFAAGLAKAPGSPQPQTDIDILGTYDKPAKAFDETTEDTIGGLVVRRADNNDAPRQEVIIQKATVGGVNWNGLVELGKLSGAVRVFTDKTAGTEITFNGTDNKFDNLTKLPLKLYVQGETGSAAMRDSGLKTRPVVGGAAVEQGSDEVKYTVLWVDVDVHLDKNEKVSADNDKLQKYKNRIYDIPGTNQPDKLLPLGKLGVSDALGPHVTDPKQDRRIGWGPEGRGAVSPKDFFYPGADLHLAQDAEVWQHATFVSGEMESKKWLSFSGPLPGNVYGNKGANDTAADEWRDDDPRDSNGFIYYLDDPGLNNDAWVEKGIICRVRDNFKALAVITIDGKLVRPSGIMGFFVRFSIIQTLPGKAGGWDLLDPAAPGGVEFDNMAEKSLFTKTTWNLQSPP